MLSEVITFNSGVERHIDQPFGDPQFGGAIRRIIGENGAFIGHFTEALATIHKRPEDQRYLQELISELLEKAEYYFGPQKVHWYWNEFYTTLKQAHVSGRYTRFSIQIKACKERYLYTLAGLESQGDKNDKWVLLHEPFFKKSPPPRPGEHARAEDIRGLADTLFFLAPVLLNIPSLDAMISFLSWFDLRLICTVSPNSNEFNQLQLNINPEISETKCISLPPSNQLVLTSSPNVRDALENLAEVWLHQKAKSVLISAAPGSGKEVFIRFLEDALRLESINIIEASAAAIGSYNSLVADLLEDRLPKSRDQDSEIESHRVMLILDEIHHDAAKDLRAGLLRLMEIDKLRSRGGTSLQCDNILYVFAASRTPEELRTLPPPDLWTRIEHTVILRHPLHLNVNDGDRREILIDYFILFWKAYKRKIIFPLTEKESAPELLIELDYFVTLLAEEFAAQLSSPLIPLVSLRVLRSIVKRLRSRTQFYLRTHPQIVNTEMKVSILPTFREWIIEMFTELAPESYVRGLF